MFNDYANNSTVFLVNVGKCMYYYLLELILDVFCKTVNYFRACCKYAIYLDPWTRHGCHFSFVGEHKLR